MKKAFRRKKVHITRKGNKIKERKRVRWRRRVGGGVVP